MNRPAASDDADGPAAGPERGPGTGAVACTAGVGGDGVECDDGDRDESGDDESDEEDVGDDAPEDEDVDDDAPDDDAPELVNDESVTVTPKCQENWLAQHEH